MEWKQISVIVVAVIVVVVVVVVAVVWCKFKFNNSTDPPSSPPLISGVQDGGNTEGESLSLSCSVTGGQPPVTSVTFWCGDVAGESPDTTTKVNGVTTVTSGVTFDRLDLTMNGTVCQCSAPWSERPSLYTQTATATITVIGVYLCLFSYKAQWLVCNFTWNIN